MKIEEVIQVVKETLDQETEVTSVTDLVDDLGFDSLKYIDLIVILENEHGIVIEEEKLADIKTVQQLYEACCAVAA